MNADPVDIVLVEDNPDHAELIRLTLARNRFGNRMIHLDDGEKAIDYFFTGGGAPGGGADPPPMVVLLDLRLPKVDGLEVLRRLKSHAATRCIPVVVLTTSAANGDIHRAYEYGVNSYLVKPVTFDSFTALMKELGYYWLMVNRHPAVGGGPPGGGAC